MGRLSLVLYPVCDIIHVQHEIVNFWIELFDTNPSVTANRYWDLREGSIWSLYCIAHTHKAVCSNRCCLATHHTPMGELQLVKAITVVLFPLIVIGLPVNESMSEFWPWDRKTQIELRIWIPILLQMSFCPISGVVRSLMNKFVRYNRLHSSTSFIVLTEGYKAGNLSAQNPHVIRSLRGYTCIRLLGPRDALRPCKADHQGLAGCQLTVVPVQVQFHRRGTSQQARQIASSTKHSPIRLHVVVAKGTVLWEHQVLYVCCLQFFSSYFLELSFPLLVTQFYNFINWIRFSIDYW